MPERDGHSTTSHPQPFTVPLRVFQVSAGVWVCCGLALVVTRIPRFAGAMVVAAVTAWLAYVVHCFELLRRENVARRRGAPTATTVDARNARVATVALVALQCLLAFIFWNVAVSFHGRETALPVLGVIGPAIAVMAIFSGPAIILLVSPGQLVPYLHASAPLLLLFGSALVVRQASFAGLLLAAATLWWGLISLAIVASLLT